MIAINLKKKALSQSANRPACAEPRASLIEVRFYNFLGGLAVQPVPKEVGVDFFFFFANVAQKVSRLGIPHAHAQRHGYEGRGLSPDNCARQGERDVC